MVECSGRGNCNRATGACSCYTGYGGTACEQWLCPMTVGVDERGNKTAIPCSGHGRCVTMAEAAATRDDVNFFRETTYSLWDKDAVMGCACDPGYTGYDCSRQFCPRGDDPATPGVDEVQAIACDCGAACSGGVYLALRHAETGFLSASATTAALETALEALDGVGAVTVSATGGTLCSNGGVTTSVTFTHTPGDLPLLRVVASTLPGTATLSVTETTPGTREWAECSNRGACNSTSGICTCAAGATASDGAGGVGTRADCGAGTLTNCPTNLAGAVCSGHGTCSGAFACACETGYTGAACEKVACPTGLAWFDEAVSPDVAHQTAECSNRGLCTYETGTCSCGTGTTGAGCQNMTAPLVGTVECGGTGASQSIFEAGAARLDNGMSSPKTYTGWDAHKIRGCNCNGFFGWARFYNGAYYHYKGFDCSVRTCAVGDDPMTTGQVDEVQRLECTATGGRFRLAFREVNSVFLDWNATEIDLFYALRNMSSLSKPFLPAAVSVVTTPPATNGAFLCGASGVYWNITFRGEFGNLPEIVPTSRFLTGGTLTVATLVDGTKETAECSNHGICNRKTGQCKCLKEWGTSNGYGEPGLRGDCGARSLDWAFIDPTTVPGGKFAT